MIGKYHQEYCHWLARIPQKQKTVAWLFAGRIIDGFAAGNITTAQTLLADIAKR
jgi:hypothetical protein